MSKRQDKKVHVSFVGGPIFTRGEYSLLVRALFDFSARISSLYTRITTAYFFVFFLHLVPTAFASQLHRRPRSPRHG